MWLRSKYEKMVDRSGEFENLQMNTPVNMDLVQTPIKKDLMTSEHHSFYIGFHGHDYTNTWNYKTSEERDAEYEWILSQLDCRVNDGIPKTNISEPLTTKYVMNDELELLEHSMSTIEKNEIVLSINNADKLRHGEICRIKYMDTVFWCESHKLTRFK